MQLIFNESKSFVRTGDGECKIIIGMDQPFQNSIPEYYLWHQAFAHKNIIVVCGEGILEKCQYDVFELEMAENVGI